MGFITHETIEDEPRPESLQRSGADPGHAEQVFRPPIWTCMETVFHDPRGENRAHSGEFHQGGNVGRVGIDATMAGSSFITIW